MNKKRFRKARNSESGLTLIELVIALALLLVVAVGVLSLGAIAMATTENQGHLMARTAEYAQDKMEQLLALKFCDATSDTTVIPAISAEQQWNRDRRQFGSQRPRRGLCRLSRRQRKPPDNRHGRRCAEWMEIHPGLADLLGESCKHGETDYGHGKGER